MSSKPTKPVAKIQPHRGEIWQVDLDPTLGSEIQKIRPVVVISSDAIGRLPIKLVAPITGWNAKFSGNIWHIRLVPDTLNNLTKESAVDTLQLRGLDIIRFKSKIGQLTVDTMEEIITAIAAVIEFS
ncbi:type II toxin-antitoxin system PemK/MazF family toxin [Anthocerotibacter panamensis]|uniref:type II toxin-antitoxin system PemK/MazF family toxin n=1 Tax=Anthocerotibacter panamensis TaxID=2857077 RepID=UPI001C403867|nr:type II toxin-antitoxin system PemK/MazF family toxin [Anthocerotibacter panamensis]